MNNSAIKSTHQTEWEEIQQVKDELRPIINMISESKISAAEWTLADVLLWIEEFLKRFVSFTDPCHATVVALWVAHSWAIEAFEFTPYLNIYSPTRRCGKSTLLECLNVLVYSPLLIIDPSGASLMRVISQLGSTILLDEIDTVYGPKRHKGSESLRAVLNSGFRRGAVVPRCSGNKIIQYSVFCAKIFAGIGNHLPDTVKDRSIRVQIARRPKNHEVEKLRLREVSKTAKDVSDWLSSWSSNEEVIKSLITAKVDVPSELGDRAADISEPLFAIAEMAGETWPDKARAAIIPLLKLNDQEESEEECVRLLRAISDVFQSSGRTLLKTEYILRKLAERDDEEEWTMQWRKKLAAGNTLGAASNLAMLLRPFEIKSGNHRMLDGTVQKGYRLEDFSDVFRRYLS